MSGKTFVMKWTRKSEFILPHDDDITKIIVSTPPHSVASITVLNLNGNSVTNLKNAWKLKNVREVLFQNCDLDFVPNWVESLPCLQYIYLDNNNLEELPNWLITLQNLERVDLQGNPLERIPAFHYLRMIKIGKSDIPGLPYDFFHHQLKSVWICDNKGICHNLLMVSLSYFDN